MNESHASGPLAGIRVLDFTRVLSGPHCTRMLCDLGAEVIKVEPPAGDLTRFATPRVNGLATYFVQQNVGKKNISLDLSSDEAARIVLGLAERCDVVVENFRPGVADRLGIGYEAIAVRNPQIVYASISGYGQDGPWRTRRAYAAVVGAESGLLRAQGDARAAGGVAHYANDPHSHGDVYTALECASAVLAALFRRERTGRGDRIDVSMTQTLLYVNEHVHDHLWDGPVADDWIRSFRPGDYPVLTAADGSAVVVSGHPAERGTFELFARGMGRPELVDDPRFVDVTARLAHYDDLVRLLHDWAATMPDPAAIEAALAAAGLAVGALRTVRDVCDTDWAHERHVVVDVPDRAGGSIRVPNSPWRFASGDVSVAGEPRYRGEDNRTVLTELLGMSDDEVDRLERDGVLSSRVPPI